MSSIIQSVFGRQKKAKKSAAPCYRESLILSTPAPPAPPSSPVPESRIASSDALVPGRLPNLLAKPGTAAAIPISGSKPAGTLRKAGSPMASSDALASVCITGPLVKPGTAAAVPTSCSKPAEIQRKTESPIASSYARGPVPFTELLVIRPASRDPQPINYGYMQHRAHEKPSPPPSDVESELGYDSDVESWDEDEVEGPRTCKAPMLEREDSGYSEDPIFAEHLRRVKYLLLHPQKMPEPRIFLLDRPVLDQDPDTWNSLLHRRNARVQDRDIFRKTVLNSEAFALQTELSTSSGCGCRKKWVKAGKAQREGMEDLFNWLEENDDLVVKYEPKGTPRHGLLE